MKKKLFITLLIVTICSMAIGLYITRAIDQVIFKLNNIVMIQQVQTLQEKLVFELRKVQSRLISKDTPFATDMDSVTNEVADMSRTMNSCFNCHHTEDITDQLRHIQQSMDTFKTALSRAFTIRAEGSRYTAAAEEAYSQGQELLQHLDELIFAAKQHLEKRAKIAMGEISTTQRNVTILVFCIPLLVLIIGFYLLRSFTNPLSSLLEATRKLTGGDLHYRVTGLKNEFGALAESFNSMAESIMQQMKNMQRTEQMSALGKLATGFAHEIKNPLAGIKVSMEVLADELDIEEADRRILRMVILEINHINTLVNEMLNYARPSQSNFERLSIHQALDRVIEAASYSIPKPAPGTSGQREIMISKEFVAGNLQVNADPDQLQQIFINILLNGIESMPNGGKLTIKTFLPAAKGTLGINIADTGPGLDEMTREKVFEPFFTTKKKGTGLGLAISKRLVEQHNGSIVADNNREGGGTSFSVYLPIDFGAEGSIQHE